MRFLRFARISKNIIMIDIKISEYSGFCFGVKRAVDMINEHLDAGDKNI